MMMLVMTMTYHDDNSENNGPEMTQFILVMMTTLMAISRKK